MFFTGGTAQCATISGGMDGRPSAPCRRRVAVRRLLRFVARFGHNYKEMNELSKEAVKWLTVGDDAAGQRVDNFLTRVLKGVPKSHIYRILRSGEVRVNKGRVGPDARLGARATSSGCRRCGPRRPRRSRPSRPAPARPSRLPILYEDDALIVVDKPAGLAVHGGSGIAPGLIEQMRAARPDARFLELVHRLDRDTSGVLLRREEALGAGRAARAAARGGVRQALPRAGARPLARREAARAARAAQVLDARRRAARARRGRRRAGRRDDLPPPRSVARPRSAAGAARGGAADRPHAPDPRAPRASGLPAGRRRQVRRLRVEQGAGEGRAEADVPARAAADVRASGRPARG